MGVEAQNLRRQCPAVGLGDIGRVGQDHVERPRKAGRPIPDLEARPRAQAQALCVVRRHGDGIRADVDAEPLGPRQFRQHRKQQTARTGAEIENAKHLPFPAHGADSGQRVFDQGFRFRARRQRRRGDPKGQGPEFTFPQNTRHGLVRGAAGDQVLGRGLLRGG